jgi:hypothetical protein
MPHNAAEATGPAARKNRRPRLTNRTMAPLPSGRSVLFQRCAANGTPR